MNYQLLMIVVCFAALNWVGCARKPDVPNIDSIESVDASLNDPGNPTYWNFQGSVPEENWSKILDHLSVEPYTNEVLKWQGLAVIEIHTRDGERISVVVFDTGNSVGCYKCGGYFKIPDEQQFANDLKNMMETKDNSTDE